MVILCLSRAKGMVIYMRIIIDAMSGDNAPSEIVKGAVEAIREFGVSVTLVGKEADVHSCLEKRGRG